MEDILHLHKLAFYARRSQLTWGIVNHSPNHINVIQLECGVDCIEAKACSQTIVKNTLVSVKRPVSY